MSASFFNRIFLSLFAPDHAFQRQYDENRALTGKHHELSLRQNTTATSVLIGKYYQVDKNILVNYFSAGKSKILKN